MRSIVVKINEKNWRTATAPKKEIAVRDRGGNRGGEDASNSPLMIVREVTASRRGCLFFQAHLGAGASSYILGNEGDRSDDGFCSSRLRVGAVGQELFNCSSQLGNFACLNSGRGAGQFTCYGQ